MSAHAIFDGRLNVPVPDAIMSGHLTWTVEDEAAVRRFHGHLLTDREVDCELWESTRAGTTTVSCSYVLDGLSVTVRSAT